MDTRLDHGHGIPWKDSYSIWPERKEARLEIENKQIDGATNQSAAKDT